MLDVLRCLARIYIGICHFLLFHILMFLRMQDRGPLDETEAAHVMRAVLDVIHECHNHHISFGDIKASNFM